MLGFEQIGPAVPYSMAWTLIARLFARIASSTIPLRTVIGLAFTLILLLSGGSLVWLDHRATLDLLQKQVDQQFDILVAGVTSQIALQFEGADAVLDTLAMSPPSMADPEAAALVLARVLGQLVETSPAVKSLVTAEADGRYILIEHLAPESREAGRPAAFDLQIGAFVGGQASEHGLRLDENFAVLERSGPVTLAFDARGRPWYTLAAATPRAVTTPLYMFYGSDRYGFTLSRRAQADPGRVFGIDMRLDSLSTSLRRGLVFEGEHVAIFAPEGSLMGDSGGLHISDRLGSGGPLPSDPPSPLRRLDEAIFAAYRRNPAAHDVAIDVDGAAVYANIAPFVVNGTSLVVASTVPAAQFEAPATRLLLWSLLIQAGVVALAFMLVGLASRLIARPIGALASDVEEIIGFHFPQRPRGGSRISEIRRLLAAVDLLELTLRAFSTYLPPGFVRTLVDGGRAPVLGVRREPVIVMFTDIEGFTGISEAMAPEELMPQLSRYFSGISDEILSSGGTLDKFIGDSVMAFWPLPPEEPGRAATVCRAVLRARESVDALNALFLAEGKPVLPTRFGLHAGYAMVGSVGTADRMNYTALGHTVNVAARIEQLNKVYGTRVLVSAALRDAAGPEIRFRHVDDAPVRGTQDRVDVYELIGAAPDAVPEIPCRAAPDGRMI